MQDLSFLLKDPLRDPSVPAAHQLQDRLLEIRRQSKLPAATRERIALAVAEITANRNGTSNDPKGDAAVRFAAKVVSERGGDTFKTVMWKL